ncbi:hypothetical protein ACEWY4_021214 [Coilia grayii]|uniref:Uncharacterized protein n=1 Tax=Coilia grayii TaxID=363190 RepID=A0ABD1J8D5_9TELE
MQLPLSGHRSRLDPKHSPIGEDMDVEHTNRSQEKATTAASARLTSFTFVPILAKLPTKSRIIHVGRKLLPSLFPSQSLEDPDRDTSDESSMEAGVYKAEFVYIRDSEETEPGDSPREAAHTKMLRVPSTDLITQTPPSPPPSPSPSPSTPVPALSEKTICYSSNPSPASPRVAMETKTDKHAGFSLWAGRRSTSPGINAGGSGGVDFNHDPEPDGDEPLSPATSVDLLTSLVSSSRESILSEGWDRDKSWSAPYLQSPAPSPAPSSLSRTWSPCSSIRSGNFSPAVVRVTRHSLAPGASLLGLAPGGGVGGGGGGGSCSSSRVTSRGTSPCPSVSPGTPRHRPPPTQLSLLTAILRKGRLPVLSASAQRPYSPCWPISPSHMSSCAACRAAARVGPMMGGTSEPCDSESAHKPLPRRSCQTPELKPILKEQQRVRLSDGSYTPTDISTERSKSESTIWDITPSKPSFPAARTFTTEKFAADDSRRVLKPVNSEIRVSPAPSPQLYTSFSQVSRSLSPKPSYAYCCTSEGPDVKSQPGHRGIACCAGLQSNTERLPNSENSSAAVPYLLGKPSPVTHTHRLSPLPRMPQLSSPRRTPTPIPPTSVSPAPCLLSCRPDSGTPTPTPTRTPTPTPDRFTLSPSPAVLSRDLTPSPSFPPSSTPSPTPKGRVSVSADREDKKSQLYKIKSSYKALAAIPTNTLLQEQQAIDTEVDKKENADPTEKFSMEEARGEMYSPAQLRAQSEELYAAIDEVLESPVPGQPLLPPSPTTRREEADLAKKYTPRSSPRTVGRETKYATYHFKSVGPTEQHVTKPGVIRPASVTPRLPTDDDEEEYFPNPFKTYLDNNPRKSPCKFASSRLEEPEADGGRPFNSQSFASSGGMKSSLFSSAPQLTTTAQSGSKWDTTPATLGTTLAKMEVHETDI